MYGWPTPQYGWPTPPHGWPTAGLAACPRSTTHGRATRTRCPPPGLSWPAWSAREGLAAHGQRQLLGPTLVINHPVEDLWQAG